MKRTATLLLAMLSINLSAQIVLDKNDFPIRDKVYPIYTTYDFWGMTSPIDWGQGGADEVYDFSALDTFDFDTSQLVFTTPTALGFGNEHPNAQYMATLENEKALYRAPLELNANDFSPASGNFDIVTVAGTNGFFSLNEWLFIAPEFNFGEYDLQDIDFFPTDTQSLELLDPANTPFASDYPNAGAARIAEVRYENQQPVLITYQFYQLVNGEVLTAGFGISYDVGFATSQSPNGTLKHQVIKHSGKQQFVSDKWKVGSTFRDTLSYRTEIKEGMATLIRNHRTRSFGAVRGSGILYLPHDSFEVLAVQKVEVQITADSALFLGNFIGGELNIDTNSYIEYWAKDQALPVATVYFNNLNFDSITTATFRYVPNTAAFSPTEIRTLFSTHQAYGKTDQSFFATGITTLVDMGILGPGGGLSGELDTAHYTYEKPQVLRYAGQTYGQSGVDTLLWRAALDDGNYIHREETIRSANIDGYGKMYLQQDTVEVLRMAILESIAYTDSIYIDGAWEVETFSDSTWHMHFLAKDLGIPLVRLEMDSAWINVWSASLTDVPSISVGKAKTPALSMAVYPNPAQDYANITLPENHLCRVNLYNAQGQLLSSASAKGVYRIDVSAYPAQNLIVQVLDTETKQLYKQKLQVN